MPDPVDCDVLVVGAGPVGALLACLLGDLGVSVVVVEQAQATYDLPRAAVIDDEVLRIFQTVGVDAEVLAASQAQRTITYRTAAGRPIEILRPDHGPFGHPPMVSIHQPSIERTLVARIGEIPQVELRWGTRVEAIDRAADHVDAWVRPVAGGRRERVRSRFLVGCEGAAGAVRARIGASFAGSTFAQRWIVIDALVDRPVAHAPHPHFVGDPQRPTVSLPMSPGRHRWEFMLHPEEDPEPLLRPAKLQQLVRPWTDGAPVEIERAVVYAFHARTASRWRRGRVFLAGDAAHVMPPFVGQGFSSGARDAGNLAWKLAAVLRGAPDALLDSYEQERRPHVAQMQRMAVRWGGVLQTTSPRTAAARDRILPALERIGVMEWVRENVKPLPTYPSGAFARRPHRLPFRRGIGALFPQPLVSEPAGPPVRLDELLGRGWGLISADEQSAAVLGRGVERVLVLGRDLEDVEGAIGDWLARHHATWVLLRPDRYVFALGGPAEAPRALEALRTRVGPSAPGRVATPAAVAA
ncbi:MAG: bifunctional 3-(3-hydroxy-phenyl)propionate/3-hydroxycinnamic acid hydroxylase [Patulibacter sp.]